MISQHKIHSKQSPLRHNSQVKHQWHRQQFQQERNTKCVRIGERKRAVSMEKSVYLLMGTTSSQKNLPLLLHLKQSHLKLLNKQPNLLKQSRQTRCKRQWNLLYLKISSWNRFMNQVNLLSLIKKFL
jgi:hypothetical protein